ncbi:hypothetical protein [Bacillus sp. FJAT-27245]
MISFAGFVVTILAFSQKK